MFYEYFWGVMGGILYIIIGLVIVLVMVVL